MLQGGKEVKKEIEVLSFSVNIFVVAATEFNRGNWYYYKEQYHTLVDKCVIVAKNPEKKLSLHWSSWILSPCLSVFYKM